MTLASGQLPYNYEHGKGRFRVPNPYLSNFPIGASGILLEQAQFVITAERRKLLKFINGSSFLDDFFVYINPIIVPSGPYEPKTNGSTLGNEIYPAASFIVTHIQDTRTSLNNFFNFFSQDTNLNSAEYRAAWLQALYPESPSGFYFGTDPDLFTDVTGHWSHRTPSETGVIDYISDDVLGASGILYDTDIGEVMWNPPPHISAFGLDTMHDRKVDGTNDGFSVQQFPLFPAFQKTDGSIITLTGREPTFIRQASDYNIDHITSGAIRVNGYTLFGNTKLYLGKASNIFDTSSLGLNVISEGIRQVLFGGNVDGSRIFATPTAQISGVYRIASKNKFIDFPTTTIESGKMSFWPNITSYWPNGINPADQVVGSTTTLANLGYHIFNDCIWMTDVSVGSFSPTGFCSGLSLLSPFTGHRLWIRYAAQNAVPSIPLNGFPAVNKNWSTAVGLQRLAADIIYRLHPNIQSDTTSVSGQCVFIHHNDDLDFIASFTTTSDNTQTGTTNQFPTGTSNFIVFHDYWYDDSGTEHWVSNKDNTGIDVWKFDTNFKYINKYIFNTPSGIFNARGFFNAGNHYLFHGEFGPLGQFNIIGSGIYPVHILSEGTDPYAGDSTIPSVGSAAVYPWEAKRINAAPFIGFRDVAQIMDIFVVSSATHVIPGIYALVNWSLSGGFNQGEFYLVRIEESVNTWEVKSISRLETNITEVRRREILYMPY